MYEWMYKELCKVTAHRSWQILYPHFRTQGFIVSWRWGTHYAHPIRFLLLFNLTHRPTSFSPLTYMLRSDPLPGHTTRPFLITSFILVSDHASPIVLRPYRTTTTTYFLFSNLNFLTTTKTKVSMAAETWLWLCRFIFFFFGSFELVEHCLDWICLE